jgi:hypothetical protein
MHAGNQPALLVTSSLRSINVNAAAATYSSRGNATVHVETNDGTTEREFCNAGGTADAATSSLFVVFVHFVVRSAFLVVT